MTEINELFDEGITRAGQLTEATDTALASVTKMLEAAEALGRRVREEGEAACGHLRDLTARLQQAEGEIESARSEVETAVDALGAKAGELVAEVSHLEDRVRGSVAEVTTGVDHAGKSIDTGLVTAHEGFQTLATKAHEAGESAQQHVEQSGQSLNDFGTAAAKAHAEVAEKQAAWSTAGGNLDEAAHRHGDAWISALQGMLGRHVEALRGVTDGLVDHHNAALDGVKQRLVEAAPQELATALEPLRAALDHLGEQASARAASLSAEAQELEQWVSQALPIVDTVHTALESTSKLG